MSNFPLSGKDGVIKKWGRVLLGRGMSKIVYLPGLTNALSGNLSILNLEIPLNCWYLLLGRNIQQNFWKEIKV